jgi:hypothetical protein
VGERGRRQKGGACRTGPDSKASDADKKAAQQIVAVVKKPAKDRNAKQNQSVEDYFRSKVTQLYKAERDAVTKAERERKAFYDPLPKCIVSVSDTNKRTVRILPRGNWMDESGEVVKAGAAWLPAEAEDRRP